MVLVPSNMFKPFSNFLTDGSKAVLLCGSFFLFVLHVYLCHTVLSVPCMHVVTCWVRADLLALLCVTFSGVFATLSYDVLGEVWCWILSILDLCLLFTNLDAQKNHLTEICFLASQICFWLRNRKVKLQLHVPLLLTGLSNYSTSLSTGAALV